MARVLPPNPNLDHLRKQAKALLPVMRRRNPAAKLADAQQAIAATYGFRDWPGIKTHIDALAAAKSRISPSPTSPLVGVWAVNAQEKAQSHTDEAFERAIVEITIIGQRVTLADVVVDSAGLVECQTNELQVDGLEHAGTHDYALVSTWLGAATLEVVVKKAGRTVSRVTYSVSSDGTTLTVDASTSAHDGYPEVARAVVFERLESSRTAA